MVQRVFLLLATVFFVTMNVLLWRSEFAGESDPKGKVPVDLVMQRILTSPDNSALEIRQRTEKIGYARWSANVGEEVATGKVLTEEFTPEAQVKRLANYTVDFDGMINVGSPTNRVRFFVGMKFDTNRNWQEFSLRLTQRPHAFSLIADKTREVVRFEFRMSDDKTGEGPSLSRELKFDQLRNPEKLAGEIGGPWLAALAAGPLSQVSQARQELSTSFQWEARQDWMEMHTARVKIYRLRARLFADREIVVYVSRVGEILKVELPNGIVLVNDELRL